MLDCWPWGWNFTIERRPHTGENRGQTGEKETKAGCGKQGHVLLCYNLHTYDDILIPNYIRLFMCHGFFSVNSTLNSYVKPAWVNLYTKSKWELKSTWFARMCHI